MQKVLASWGGQILLLVFTCAGFIVLWSIPVFIIGSSFEVFHHLEARTFAESGMFSFRDELGRFIAPSLVDDLGVVSASHGRLSAMIFAWISQWIPWENLLGWAYVGAISFSLCLLPWWILVRKLFGSSVAWTATLLFALLPEYWHQALWLDQYTFALLFFFCAMAAFAVLRERTLFGALAVSGFFFGLSIAAKDAFLIVMPWMAAVYLYSYRKRLPQACAALVVFFALAGSIYLAPYLDDIRTYGYPVNQNIARIWPGSDDIANETYLHLYPDPYTYYFDQERFDREYVEHLTEVSSLERALNQKIILRYGLVDEPLRFLRTSMWLFVNSLPSFIQRVNTGGAFLWLFVLVGCAVFWEKDRKLLWWSGGFILTALLVLSFILQYSRDHFVAYGWIIALLAALGIVELSRGKLTQQLSVRSGTLLGIITAIVCVQLVQENRYELAYLYGRSVVPRARAEAQLFQKIPLSSAIAAPGHPGHWQNVIFLADRTVALFQEETVERLLREGKLVEAFTTYGVTHIYGYPDDLAQELLWTMPSLERITVQEYVSSTHNVGRGVNFLLHMVR